jgi:hypothetical protein
VVNGSLRGAKEQRSFKPQAAGSIPAGRIVSLLDAPRLRRPDSDHQSDAGIWTCGESLLTFCVKPDLYVLSGMLPAHPNVETGGVQFDKTMEGPDNGLGVKQDARPGHEQGV